MQKPPIDGNHTSPYLKSSDKKTSTSASSINTPTTEQQIDQQQSLPKRNDLVTSPNCEMLLHSDLPSFVNSAATPEQLCRWDDQGRQSVRSACLEVERIRIEGGKTPTFINDNTTATSDQPQQSCSMEHVVGGSDLPCYESSFVVDKAREGVVGFTSSPSSSLENDPMPDTIRHAIHQESEAFMPISEGHQTSSSDDDDDEDDDDTLLKSSGFLGRLISNCKLEDDAAGLFAQLDGVKRIGSSNSASYHADGVRVCRNRKQQTPEEEEEDSNASSSSPSSTSSLPDRQSFSLSVPEASEPSASEGSPVTETSTSSPSIPLVRLWNQTGTRNDLRRKILSNLNKMTLENFPSITEDTAQLMESKAVYQSDIHLIANLLVERALLEQEFSEMYGDCIQVLRWRCPLRFCVREQTRDMTLVDIREYQYDNLFHKCVMDRLQFEFSKFRTPLAITADDWVGAPDDSDEQSLFVRKKHRIMGMAVLVGELFVRNLISLDAMRLFASKHIMSAANPEEHYIECVVKMLMTAGVFIGPQNGGTQFLEQVIDRLRELQNNPIHTYSQRIQCLIQDLIDAHGRGWYMKVHKLLAVSLREFRNENEQSANMHASQYDHVIRLGIRNNLLQDINYADYMREQHVRHENLVVGIRVPPQSSGMHRTTSKVSFSQSPSYLYYNSQNPVATRTLELECSPQMDSPAEDPPSTHHPDEDDDDSSLLSEDDEKEDHDHDEDDDDDDVDHHHRRHH